MKKILFSDIDGTIANDNLPITYKDQEAVKKLRTQGHYFSFCTGRNIQETKLVTPHFEYDYLVLNNGAMIVDQNDQVLYRKQIKNEIAKEILKEKLSKISLSKLYIFWWSTNIWIYKSKNNVF